MILTYLSLLIRLSKLKHDTKKIFQSVVGCTTRRDFAVTKHALPKIDEYIKSKKIILCVPDRDYDVAISDFSNTNLNAELIIKKDSDFINKEDQEFLKNELDKFNNIRMYGWYIQQFTKLSMLNTEAGKQGYSIIWDMDTIPLRPLCFFTEQEEVLNCFYTTKYHEPYFNTINNLFHIEKVSVNSFIAQCLPVSHKYYREFIAELEELDCQSWLSNLIRCLDYKVGATFSEYETIGTYIEASHPGAYNFVDTNWKRDAYRDFIKARRNIAKLISIMTPYYSFIAIEKHNRSLLKMIANKIWSIF